MQFRKLNVAKLNVGEIYVAYSSKNKHLAANGPRGVFVKVIEKKGKNVKVQVLGTLIETAITNLEAREDAWVYSPAGVKLPVRVEIHDKAAWPGFTPRMEREGWDGKEFALNMDEIFLVEDVESPGNGLTLLRHEGETIDPDENAPYINNFLMCDIIPLSPPEWRIPRAERMGMGAIELPLPPKPVAEQHKELIVALTPHLEELRNRHTAENVSFEKFSADLKKSEAYRNQVCHRCIQTTERFKVAYVTTIGYTGVKGGSWVNSQKITDEALRLWVTYLANYSPYADAVITKDPDFIIKYGYILDASAPARMVVGLCYASRQVWEKPQRAEGFLELYKQGIEINAAFLFGSQCSEYRNGKMKFAQGGESHSHLCNSRLSNECAVNFIKHQPEFPGLPYCENPQASNSDHGGDYGVDGTWSSAFRVGTKVYPLLAELKANTGGWGGALAVEDAAEQAADIIDEWMGRMGL